MPKKQKSGGKKYTTPRNRKSLASTFNSPASGYSTPNNGRNASGKQAHFSLRDEVMNTERHHEQWTPAKRLRDQKINFVSAGTIGPPEDADVDDPLATNPQSSDDNDIELDHDLEDLDASDGAMAELRIAVDSTPAGFGHGHIDSVWEESRLVLQDTPVDAQDAMIIEEATLQETTVVIEEPAAAPAPAPASAPVLVVAPIATPVTAPAATASAEPADDPLASMFFVDTQGDNHLAFKGPKTAPPPRPASPAPSDSSEEVVFRGRGVVVQDDPPASKAPLTSSSGKQPLDALMQALERQDEATAPAPVVNWGVAKPAKEEPKHWMHADGTVAHKQQEWPVAQPQPRLNDILSAVKPAGRKSKKSRKKQNKLFRQQLDPEDEMLQDYIDNMDPEERAAFGIVGSGDDSEDDLFNQLLDQEESVDGLNPADIVGMDTSSGSDSWNTDNGEDEDEDGEDDEDEEGDDLDDLDSSDLESELEYHEREQWEDEADLRQRQRDAMTDEEIARLLAKQEEYGLGGDDILLFDDSGFGDVSAAREGLSHITNSGPRSRNKASARKTKRAGKRGADSFPDASLMADVLDQDPYNGFDVMDFDRPSLRTKPKGRKSAGPLPEELGISDEELISELQSAWTNDRSKKAAKKAEREELRQLGLLGKKNKFKPDLSVRYDEGISMTQVRVELRDFLDDEEHSAKHFPPMAKADRKVLHEIANLFNLKSKSVGSGKNRAPVLIKTSRTIDFSEEHFSRAQQKIQRSFFRQPGKKGKSDNFAFDKKAKRGGGAGAVGGYANGQVVGAAAPELGQNNFGRKLMEKMGWQAGMALGKDNVGGLLVPVEARIKSGKAGLG